MDKLNVEITYKKVNGKYVINIINSDNNVIVNELNEQLEEYNNIIRTHTVDFINGVDNYSRSNDSTKDIGAIGEKYIYEFLARSMKLSDNEVEIVNGKKNSGDIYLRYNNIHCCIESKNHASPISMSAVNRFINVDVQNPRYNCGIFVSIRTKYVKSTNINNFDILVEKNKPMIFLSEFLNNEEYIILAVKVLDRIITNKYNEDKLKIYINEIKKEIHILNSTIEINNLCIKNLNTSNIDLTDRITNINNFLKEEQC